jgi:hypothetical protein
MPPGACGGTPADPESSRGAVLAIAGATLVAHLAVSWRNGFFRDELYFIDCGRYPAFGYIDQPPVVPLVAASDAVVRPQPGRAARRGRARPCWDRRGVRRPRGFDRRPWGPGEHDSSVVIRAGGDLMLRAWPHCDGSQLVAW